MPDPALTEAIQEAYASAPDDVAILPSLEIRHPVFVDENNNPTAIRVILDHRDWIGRHEATAPMDPGAFVTYTGAAFNIDLPPVDQQAQPRALITIDNVSEEVITWVELAAQDQRVTELTFRPWLSNDVDAQGRLNGPHMDPPLHLVITSIKADLFQISAEATFGDYTNRRFPGVDYSVALFPGLAR